MRTTVRQGVEALRQVAVRPADRRWSTWLWLALVVVVPVIHSTLVFQVPSYPAPFLAVFTMYSEWVAGGTAFGFAVTNRGFLVSSLATAGWFVGGSVAALWFYDGPLPTPLSVVLSNLEYAVPLAVLGWTGGSLLRIGWRRYRNRPSIESVVLTDFDDR